MNQQQQSSQEDVCLRIQGRTPLSGVVQVAGAKNAVLPLLAASLLTGESVHLRRVPRLIDVDVMLRLLQHLGVRVDRQADQLSLCATGDAEPVAPDFLVAPIRASFLVLGPLLATRRWAQVAMPGGDAIGRRPVDEHIKGFEALGAKISKVSGQVVAQAKKGLRGADIRLGVRSVTATVNLLMAATLARGKTSIRNAAREPEIVDLARCLQKMGAKIDGAGSDCLRIQGVSVLGGAAHEVMPDRIEAGSYLIAAAATAGQVRVRGIDAALLAGLPEKLQATGASLECKDDEVCLDMGGRRPRAVDIETQPYPGFPTDLQSPMMVLNALATGCASIHEHIFENRFMQVASLRRMGAEINQKSKSQVDIKGQPTLHGAALEATDLRSAFALTLAAIAAEGESWMSRAYHLDRGYEQVDAKLRGLGANLERVIRPQSAVQA